MEVTVVPFAKTECSTVKIPPSKSMAHRSIVCAALAEGASRIDNVADSDDMKATIGAMEQLGATIVKEGDSLLITGVGSKIPKVTETVDCIESGSTLRFLIPLFALSGEKVTFTGRNRLLQRPQSVYQTLFDSQGLLFEQKETELVVQGRLKGGDITLDGSVSSQFLTGLLFALPLLQEDSILHIVPPFASRSYVLLTLQVLKEFGIVANFLDENTLQIPGNQRYMPCNYTVEGDYSQLAFFAVLGAVGRPVHCTGVRHDSLQGDKVILSLVKQAGAAVEETAEGYRIAPAPLTGRTCSIKDCPDLGPILTILGMYSEGKTVLTEAGRLRDKESDRIASMEEELGKLGVAISSTKDELVIQGGSGYGASTALYGHRDHRIVMSLAIAAVGGNFSVTIEGAECIEKSYPNFFEDLANCGTKVEVQEACGKTYSL